MKNNKTIKQKGFTLIEILIVIAIISTLLVAAVTSFGDKPGAARTATAKISIKNISTALKVYRLDNITYPSSGELNKLVPKYLDKLEKDLGVKITNTLVTALLFSFIVMVLIKLLAVKAKIKMLNHHNKNKKTLKNKGFTLIEVLVVLAIIGVLMGIVSLSINSIRPSPAQFFVNKLENSILSVKKFSRNYNKDSKIFFNQKKHLVEFYFFNGESESWDKNKKIPELSFKNLYVLNDIDNIIIRPNGFINQALISVSTDKKQPLIDLNIK
jgi:prepilin-type N-terminal cleavage/methylation domain-containing protein